MRSRVIDVHAHIGRTVAIGAAHTHTEYLETMHSAGIDVAVLSPMAGGRQAEGVRDTMRENDAIADAVREHPTRFPVGLATVEVRHEEKAIEELRRAYDELGLHGVAFHAMFSGFSVGQGTVLDPLLGLTNERAGLCLMHAMPEAGEFSMESPRAIGDLASRYPAVTFIMGHPAMTADQRAVSVEAAIGRENIYLDLAYQADPQTVEVLVRALGAERLLFGSDAPFRDPAATIRSIEAAQITDAEREQILHLNAAELINRQSS